LVVVSEFDNVAGHAFISYVREDSAHADRLQQVLEAAGVRVWRDTVDLWPGDDWRQRIRHAITDNALIFIACFSHNSISRKVTFQNEELSLAVEQLRLRPPGEPWLIPVRFDDCDIPDITIGNGRTLTSIQRADLFGDRADEGTVQLVRAVLRILSPNPNPIPVLSPNPSPIPGISDADPRRLRAAVLESIHRDPVESEGQVDTTALISDSTTKIIQPESATGSLARRELRIDILGSRESGKTTYIAALDLALARMADNWTLRGANEATEHFLTNATMMLAGGHFPYATPLGEQTVLNFLIEGDAARTHLDSPPAQVKPVRLALSLVDFSGEFSLGGPYGPPRPDAVQARLPYLAQSDGIIIFFDPVTEYEYHKQLDYYDRLRRILLALSDFSNTPDARLPQRVAVCATKLDDPFVYNKAVDGGHIQAADGTNLMPRVRHERARRFFRDLCTATNNADLVMAILEHYFDPARIRYFAISSIGFYISPETGRFDSSDFNNRSFDRKKGQKIRGRVRPVDVIAPLLWLADLQ
jgi:hypothetical protein